MAVVVSDSSYLVQQMDELIRKKNRNCVTAIVGKPGCGKSFMALELADELDPTFKDHIAERVCFTPKQFMTLLQDPALTKGCVIILDEAGVSVHNRSFFDFANKAVVYVLQTFRHRNLHLFLTTPSMSFIDSQVRRLTNYIIDCQKIDFKRNLTIAKVFEVQPNPVLGKEYKKYLRLPYKTFDQKKIVRMKFRKPDTPIWKEYEKIAEDYKRTLTANLLNELNAMQKTEEQNNIDVHVLSDKVLDNIGRYTKPDGKLDISLIEMDFRIGNRRSKRVADYVTSVITGKTPKEDTMASNSAAFGGSPTQQALTTIKKEGKSESNSLAVTE